MIPLALMKQMIYLLEHLDVSDYDTVIQYEYEDILSALTKKQQALALRRAYTGILSAKDANARDNAINRYFKQKKLYTQ